MFPLLRAYMLSHECKHKFDPMNSHGVLQKVWYAYQQQNASHCFPVRGEFPKNKEQVVRLHVT